MECGAVLFGLITFLLTFLVSHGRNYFRNVCKEMTITRDDQKFTWKFSEDSETQFVISEPPCLNQQGVIVIGVCLTKEGQWMNNSLNCVNKLRNTVCPEDLIEIPIDGSPKPLCVKVSNETIEWSDRLCLGSDATIFDLNNHERYAIHKYLESRHINSIWIPVQRADGNISNPLIWKLPGKNWGDSLTQVKYISFPDKNCLIAIVNSSTAAFEFEMRSCNEHHHTVCVFKRENLAIKSVCPKNYGAMMYEPSICYGIKIKNKSKANNETTNIGEYLKFQNKMRQIFETINYSGYFLLSPLSTKGEENKYEILVNEKQHFKVGIKRKTAYYFAVEKMSDPGSQAEMLLTFDSVLNTILLTVINPNSIWRSEENDHGIKCFTNGEYETMRSLKLKAMSLETSNQTNAMYELKLYEDRPRYYWCEAHSAYNFTHLQSNKIVASRKHKEHIFSAVLEIPCELENCQEVNGNSKEVLEKQAENIMKALADFHSSDREISIDSVKVMNITSINEDFQNLSVLCHILASLVSSDADNNDGVRTKELEEAKNSLFIRNHLKDFLKLQNLNSWSVNSTKYCFPEILSGIPNTTWPTALLGESKTIEKLCLDSDNIPITRRCVGDLLHGAMWEKVDDKLISCESRTTLQEIDNSTRPITDPKTTIKEAKEIIQTNINHLIPDDLFYLGRILGNISSKVISLKSMKNNSEIQNVTKTMISDTTRIYNNLMKVDLDVLKASTERNCTNILLDVFDRLIDEVSSLENSLKIGSNDTNDVSCCQDYCKIELKNEEIMEHKNHHYGTAAWITPKLFVSILDPNVASITGLALASNKSVSDRSSFEDFEFKFLYSNQSTDKLLEEVNLQMATFVPDILLSQLKGDPKPGIVIKYHINDQLFQEYRNISNKKVYGEIVSLSIPDRDRNLPSLLPLIMRKPFGNNVTKESCRYWNYKTWAKDEIVFLKESHNDNNLVLYGSWHLTAFAYLIASTDSLAMITEGHRDALNMITLIGCGMSLIGTVGIFITAITFRKWREKLSSRIVIQLSLAIALQMVLFCFVNTESYVAHLIENHIYSSCVALGASLQYFVLVQFSWMMIIAYVQFKRYVRVLGNIPHEYFFIKSSLIGWGLPLIPVLLVVFFDREEYIPHGSPGSTICYPTGRALYLGICLPIAVAIVINLAIFLKIMCNIINRPDITLRRNKKGDRITNIRVSVILFFLLGFSWIFGFLAFIKGGLIFSYLFSITATLQGFVMFVYFILLDPVTRKMWWSK